MWLVSFFAKEILIIKCVIPLNAGLIYMDTHEDLAAIWLVTFYVCVRENERDFYG